MLKKFKKGVKRVMKEIKDYVNNSMGMTLYSDVKDFLQKEPNDEKMNDSGTMAICLGVCGICLGIAMKVIAR